MGNPAKYICSIEDYKSKHLEGLKTHSVYKFERPFSNEQKEQMKKDLEKNMDIINNIKRSCFEKNDRF